MRILSIHKKEIGLDIDQMLIKRKYFWLKNIRFGECMVRISFNFECFKDTDKIQKWFLSFCWVLRSFWLATTSICCTIRTTGRSVVYSAPNRIHCLEVFQVILQERRTLLMNWMNSTKNIKINIRILESTIFGCQPC